VLSGAGFSHGFTTRRGGVSKRPYDELDFATARDPVGLAENQRRLARAVGFQPGALHQVHQVHGSALAVANGDPEALLGVDADALVAEPGSGHAVAVRVADCVPVLLADPASGRVAAVHAGWRGIEARILAVAAAHLASAAFAGPRAGFLAAVGPAIGPCCFEVGIDVGERIARGSTPDVIRRRAPADKAYVDLRLAVRAQLRALELDDGAIDDVPAGSAGCTRCDRARFYSYRRDGDASGRLLGVIVAGARS
jgi:polyphenol oxidase